MTEPLVLLPPSEGKAPGGSGSPWRSAGFALDLGDERATVVTALVAAMRRTTGQADLLGVKGDALERAVAANRSVDDAPTLPAIERYTGVLYDALDAGSLGPAARRSLGRRVLILSGLWGAVAPDDPIPDYKLKMGATLPELGRLAAWWRPRLTPLLDDRAGAATTWNLLPGEHAAAWAVSRERRQVVVRFLDEVAARDGSVELKAVSHWNKLLKGALVRWLVERDDAGAADAHEALVEFRHPLGYVWRPDLDTRAGGSRTVNLVKSLAGAATTGTAATGRTRAAPPSGVAGPRRRART